MVSVEGAECIVAAQRYSGQTLQVENAVKSDA